MVNLFFEQNNMKANIKGIMFNKKKNAVRVYTNDPDKAYWLYDKCNFRKSILLRELNVTLNMRLNDDEKIQYLIEGHINEKKQRAIFEKAKKYGVCDLKTNYTC